MRNKKKISYFQIYLAGFLVPFLFISIEKLKTRLSKFECQTSTWLLDEDIAPQVRFSILWLIIHP